MFTPRLTTKTISIALILLASWSMDFAHAENQTFNDVCKKCHTGGIKGLLSGAPNIKKAVSGKKYSKGTQWRK